MDILSLVGRNNNLFQEDIIKNENELKELIEDSSFLILGGAGSIGQAVTKEIFKRNPKKIHVIDISENNLVELVRDIRSKYGYIKGDFRTFALDIGSIEYQAFIRNSGNYDYILNLSALKHVRSEKDPYTLMRMIDVNILNTEKTIQDAINFNSKKYFCVSTDKAANPVNMMGASKRIMEIFLMQYSYDIKISTARFANVAFSDGSLMYGFNQRIIKRQPIVAPNDIKRYFVTPEESGQLCLMSCLLGDNKDIFFPKLDSSIHLKTFSEIAIKYLSYQGYEPYICESENEARGCIDKLIAEKKWPCFFTQSDTTGEKSFEEFFTVNEDINLDKFIDIGIVKNKLDFDPNKIKNFKNEIVKMKKNLQWNKKEILDLFESLLPEFEHKETGKYLDNKM